MFRQHTSAVILCKFISIHIECSQYLNILLWYIYWFLEKTHSIGMYFPSCQMLGSLRLPFRGCAMLTEAAVLTQKHLILSFRCRPMYTEVCRPSKTVGELLPSETADSVCTQTRTDTERGRSVGRSTFTAETCTLRHCHSTLSHSTVYQ